MRIKYLAILLLALAACGGETPEVKEPFLWEVQGEGGPTFLLGTIHLGVSADELPDIVWQAYEESQTVIVESDTRDSLSSEELETAMLPEGKTLSGMMSEDMWEDLTAALDDVSPERLDRFQPWVVSAMVAGRLRPKGEAMDYTFTARAAEQRRELVFLEDFVDVATKLDDIPHEQTVMQIAAMLYLADEYVAGIHRLMDLYRWGDVATMREEMWGIPQDAEQLEDEEAEESTSDDILLRQRNLDWFAAIKQHVRDGGSFIAVGLAHLIGPHNLLEMLEDEGYEPIRRLKHSQIGKQQKGLRQTGRWGNPRFPLPARAALYRLAE